MHLPETIPQCHHLKIDGIRCNSPARRGKRFCYYHQELKRITQRANSKSTEPLQLPPLEDAHAIQVALMQVTNAILADQISDKKAGLLLYALQTAAINLRTIEKSAPEAVAQMDAHAERLVRQEYPEAIKAMEKAKFDESPEGKNDTLARFLLRRLGIPEEQAFDQTEQGQKSAAAQEFQYPPPQDTTDWPPKKPPENWLGEIIPDIKAEADPSYPRPLTQYPEHHPER